MTGAIAPNDEVSLRDPLSEQTEQNSWWHTPRLLRLERPDLERKYWKDVLWAPSYFAASCGGAPNRISKEYIEQQKTPLPETVPYLPVPKREVFTAPRITSNRALRSPGQLTPTSSADSSSEAIPQAAPYTLLRCT